MKNPKDLSGGEGASVLDMSGLDIFNPAGIEVVTEAYEIIAEVSLPDMEGDTKILAFDQAIANTGWVVLQHKPRTVTEILAAGTIKTVTLDNRVSWDDTLERSTRLMQEALDLMWFHAPNLVLHEMPPVGQGPFMRASWSSIVAATAVRCAAHQAKLPIDQVSAQTVKKSLTGNGNAKKQEVRKVIDGLVESGALFIDPEYKIRLNEHIVDAIGLALVYYRSEQ